MSPTVGSDKDHLWLKNIILLAYSFGSKQKATIFVKEYVLRIDRRIENYQ